MPPAPMCADPRLADNEAEPPFGVVIPAKSGNPGQQGHSGHPWTPAFAGVTIHLVRTGFILSHTRKGECMKLYTYYRSQASFRVRIALNLKGIARGQLFAP